MLQRYVGRVGVGAEAAGDALGVEVGGIAREEPPRVGVVVAGLGVGESVKAEAASRTRVL